jgi:pyruvate dehydrogenase E1 component alpha subunit
VPEVLLSRNQVAVADAVTRSLATPAAFVVVKVDIGGALACARAATRRLRTLVGLPDGGSQHLRRDSYISTGIQGEGLAVGTGVALHLRDSGSPRIVAVYAGDGTWGEGAVYEALNMAQLWRLPVLVLVEHNGIAQSTATARAMAGTIAGRAAGFGITCTEVDSADVSAVRAEMAAGVARVRAEHRPHVAVFHAPRLGPHSKGDDSRAPAELARLAERDWLRAAARDDPAAFERLDARARERVAQVTAAVSARPLAGDPPW